jgi:hypothetical protein
METEGKDFDHKGRVAKKLWELSWGLLFVCAMTLFSQYIPQDVPHRICHTAVHALDRAPRHFIK